ncbi:unnamed protein product [Chilo suppressalis]|uniref:Centrobin n=1 Tax=Chilo suppressalis TaxID=168631 RepID=A0ABN8ATM1_CHISP|nr:unnamed protein product [Chilo suppressalis]
MSETDDTDVLLLIPPNFFLVNTSSSEESLLDSSRTVVHKPSCTAQVLGKLVDQVHSLESRLSNLEVNSTAESVSSFSTLPRQKRSDTTNSFDSLSVDCKYYTFPRRRSRRRTNKRERKRDLSLTSLDTPSTSTKEIPHLKLTQGFDVASFKNSDFNDNRSMDGDISSIVSTPSKKNDKLLLHEIDEFLTKVEAYESPESKFRDQMTTLSPENVIKATGDYISHKLEQSNLDDVKLPSGRIVSSNILDKYIYLVNNQPQISHPEKSHPPSISQKSNIEDTSSMSCSDIKDPPISKCDSKSPSIRKLNFSDTKDVQPTSTPKRLPPQRTSSLDSFRPSSHKIYDRATKVLEHYKSQNYSRTEPNSMINSNYLISPKKEEFKMPQMRPYRYDNKESASTASMQNKLIDSIDTDLLSLSDLWGEKGEKLERGESLKLEEERLKREHCEAMIQQLQKKILDQQEKLAVALKVDRAKDSAIAKLKEAWLRITSSLDKAEERHRTALEKMVREVENFKSGADEAQKKTNHFEAELYKALDLAHDYQNKCKQLTEEKKQLEEGMEKALANQREVISNKEREIEMLKENYNTVMKLNKQSTDCVKNLEDALNKEKTEHELTNSKSNDLGRKLESLNGEVSLLLQERDLLKNKVNEERSRSNILERQLCEKQNQTSDLLKKCDTLDYEVKTLRKQLEVQKNELKVHYQKQLEEAVLAKLQEFQQQLDHAEKELEHEARTKEDAIVDNFNKQIARIEEQHKLEVNVLEEKQKEEINLYRLQLAQVNEKVGLLENKLESYRRRRGQIASQLHGVMEAQWRQALLILTNGHHASSLDLTRPDSENLPATSTPVGQDYAPPKLPASIPALDRRSRPSQSHNSFNFEALSDNELQHYVKLLLSKPPGVEGGGDCAPAEEPTSDRPQRKRSINTSKPPWKA